VGEVRRDPFAMLPFCGYNMGDFFSHWLKLGRGADPAKLPRIYLVNWFRKDRKGRFVWPGFGENSRVLKWVVERLEGRAAARKTPIGSLPTPESLDAGGLKLGAEDLKLLLSVDPAAWQRETELIEADFAMFGDRLPEQLAEELAKLKERLAAKGAIRAGEGAEAALH
jgi:phosphoenolpyruvate carboxykinase (GTP)